MMKKSMDDDILRQKIIALLKESGSSSSDSDLNNAVMNMLKILPPPVVKLKAEKTRLEGARRMGMRGNTDVYHRQISDNPYRYFPQK